MGNKFWCGFAFAVSVSGYMQDRHGSMAAYIQYLQDNPHRWDQVPVWVWVAAATAAVVSNALLPDHAD